MAIRLIGLSSISDEEYTDIRELLDKKNISYYVTPPGNWGVSMEAIWVKKDHDIQDAHDLLKNYYHSKNIEYSIKQEADNKNKNILQTLLSNTNVMAFYLPALAIILLMVFLLS
jgi:hypothetical protein